MNTPSLAADLVCPITHQRLHVVPLEDARTCIASGSPLKARTETGRAPVTGETDTVLLREDEAAAYPIVSGIPILLAPEVLRHPSDQEVWNLNDPQYAEAYLEMAFYNSAGFAEAWALREAGSLHSFKDSESLQHLERLRLRPVQERERFPEPRKVWAHSRLDLQSEWECYQHIGSVAGQRVLQLGGSGRAVQALLLAGATEALLLTPMVGEAQDALEVQVARCGRALPHRHRGGRGDSARGRLGRCCFFRRLRTPHAHRDSFSRNRTGAAPRRAIRCHRTVARAILRNWNPAFG
jgi:uncharacterized protein YbaR (Trm112 family)